MKISTSSQIISIKGHRRVLKDNASVQFSSHLIKNIFSTNDIISIHSSLVDSECSIITLKERIQIHVKIPIDKIPQALCLDDVKYINHENYT